MNAARARETAADVLGGLVDGHLPERAEEALLSEDGVVHLANAWQQVEYADASGVALDTLPYDDLERALRQRAVDVLRDHAADASDQREHEQAIADLRPEEADR